MQIEFDIICHAIEFDQKKIITWNSICISYYTRHGLSMRSIR